MFYVSRHHVGVKSSTGNERSVMIKNILSNKNMFLIIFIRIPCHWKLDGMLTRYTKKNYHKKLSKNIF